MPCVYDYSKNAWMTSINFENWFHSEFVPAVRRHLLDKNLEPKALLLLDNCPAHPPAENLVSRCGKIKVSYLPKNTTSVIQPLDQGIIATMKCNYRRELLMKLIDEETIISECLKKVNVKEVIYIVGKAWDRVTPECIERCWNKGLGAAFDDFDGFDIDDVATAEAQLQELIATNIKEPERILELETNEIHEWIRTPDDCETYGALTDEEIIQGVTNQSSTERVGDENDEDDDSDFEMPPSATEALEGLEKGLRWLETQDVDPIRVIHLRNIVDFAKSKKAGALKQKTVFDFSKNSDILQCWNSKTC